MSAALTRRFTLRFDRVTVCLLVIVGWSAWQMVPLPESVVGTLSPGRLAIHHQQLPETSEQVATGASPIIRTNWLPLTIDHYATQTLTIRVLAVWLVYAVARNWLASRDSFPRLAWALVLNGVALAVLALGHAASAPRNVVYWDIPVDGEGAFGPFICRNHYGDYIALCAGLGIGLLLPRRGELAMGSPLTARRLGLSAAIGLMLVSIPISLSRGAILAVVLSGVALLIFHRSQGSRVSQLIMGLVSAVVLAGAFWFGTGAITERLATLGTGEATQTRSVLWRDISTLLPTYWATGTGGGTLEWIEPTVRSTVNPIVYQTSAHNEYLEAILEGGLPRFLATIVLAGALLIRIAQGAWRRQDRRVGPWLLGSWFGLAVVVVHAFGDFAIHMPAVAILAATVAGFAVAAATDTEFVSRPTRRGREPAELEPSSGASPSLGLVPVLASLGVAGLGLMVMLDAQSRYLADRYRLSALYQTWDRSAADWHTRRIEFLESRARHRPDTAAHFDLAQARLDQAAEQSWTPGAALAGGPAGYVGAPEQMLPAVAARQLPQLVQDLQAARQANPLAPKPHARLALLAGLLPRSEPAAVHFARAKRAIPTDPDLWYASGREAFRSGQYPTAWDDWKQSLTLSPIRLEPILKQARTQLTTEQMIARLLPDEPRIVWASAEILIPNRDPALRHPLIVAAAAHLGRTESSVDQQLAAAFAADELGQTEEAASTLRLLVALAPDRADVRDRVARWLEADERYEEAIPHLEWLSRRFPSGGGYLDRLEAARHALKLRAEIEGQKP